MRIACASFVANLLQHHSGMSSVTDGSAPILIVDDEVDLVATYERVLRRKGYRVITAYTLTDGLAFIDHQPLKLLVTDIRLPDGDGLDLVRAAQRLSQPPPAIVVTGFASQPGRTAALAAGAAEYLDKPVAIASFTAAVEKALEDKSTR